MAYTQLSFVVFVELLKYTRLNANFNEEEKNAISMKLRKVFRESFSQRLGNNGEKLIRDIKGDDFDIEEYVVESLLPEVDRSEIDTVQKRREYPAKCAKIVQYNLLRQASKNESPEMEHSQTTLTADFQNLDLTQIEDISLKAWQQTKELDELLSRWS